MNLAIRSICERSNCGSDAGFGHVVWRNFSPINRIYLATKAITSSSNFG